MALGFFDGLHLGHQRIIQTAKEIAIQHGYQFAVMTFYPHPKEVIDKKRGVFRYLSPLAVKKEAFFSMGVEKLYIVQFDLNFSQLSPRDFIKQYIVGLHCQHVVAGFDFTYGYKGEGNMQLLTEEGKIGKFAVTTVSKVELHNRKISSTLIREMLNQGQVDLIPQYQGGFYEVRGEVIYPNSRNTQMIYVLIDQEYMMPRSGVYKVLLEIEGEMFEGICHHIHQSQSKHAALVELINGTPPLHHKSAKVRWIRCLAERQASGKSVFAH
jgi:riboflavin kinase/FMN adenylyltransferase